jgi:hypothetical protein
MRQREMNGRRLWTGEAVRSRCKGWHGREPCSRHEQAG